MTGAEATLAIAIVALAALAQAVSGFGFALIAAPALVALLPPAAAVSAVTLLGLTVNAVMLAHDGGAGRVARGEGARLVAWALPGMAAGTLVLRHVPADALRVVVGALVLVMGFQRLLRPDAAAPVGRAASGLAAGVLTTSTGLNGPPLVLHLTRLPPPERRATLAAIFLALGLLGTAALAVAGAFRPPSATLPLAAVAVLATTAGVSVAGRTGPRTDRAVLALLLTAAGVASIVAGLV